MIRTEISFPSLFSVVTFKISPVFTSEREAEEVCAPLPRFSPPEGAVPDGVPDPEGSAPEGAPDPVRFRPPPVGISCFFSTLASLIVIVVDFPVKVSKLEKFALCPC